MIEGFLLSLGTGLCWAAIGGVFSRVARAGYQILRFQLLGMAGVTLLSWAVWLVTYYLAARTHPVNLITHLPALIWLMALAGAENALAMNLLMLTMRRGHQAASYSIGQSAMLLPFLAGVLIWRDPLHPLNILGVGMCVAGIVLFGNRKQEPGKASATPSGCPWRCSPSLPSA